MIKVYKNADMKYIEKLFIEMEQNEDNTYEIEIKENRKNTEIVSLYISVKPALQSPFED